VRWQKVTEKNILSFNKANWCYNFTNLDLRKFYNKYHGQSKRYN